MDTTSIIQTAHADTNFPRACNHGDHKLIYRLLATLYRPVRRDLKAFQASQKWNGDIREPYNPHLATERAQLFEKSNVFHIAVAAFLYYQAFRNQKLMAFKNVFTIPDADPKQRSGNDYGWAGTLLDLAKNGEFGPLEQTEQQPWSTILVSMSKNADIRKKIEEQMNKNR